MVHREYQAESRLVWQPRIVLQLTEEKRDDFPALPSAVQSTRYSPVYLLQTSLPALSRSCQSAVAVH